MNFHVPQDARYFGLRAQLGMGGPAETQNLYFRRDNDAALFGQGHKIPDKPDLHGAIGETI
jgi:hypothetical protein